MASSLHHSSTFLRTQCALTPTHTTTIQTKSPASYFLVRCGPRSNRGPLVKGRILSIEAIQAIQTLKRAHRTNPENASDVVSSTLSRLLKADLKATLRELLRQDQCALALHVFSTFRSEYGADLTLYGDMVTALARNGMVDEIDSLIVDLEKSEGRIDCEDKGLVSLIKGLIEAGRKESTVGIYGLMKKSGWGSSVDLDEYVVKTLSNGFKRFGEEGLANMVENEYQTEIRKLFRRNSSLENLRL